jgi:hypothetical protein
VIRHTWTAKPMNGGMIDIVDSRGKLIAACGGGGDYESDCAATVALFLAAPELLDCCKMLAQLVADNRAAKLAGAVSGIMPRQAVTIALAVIAKAEGGAQ